MKYETLILQTLFGACLLVCVLTFGAMITYHPPSQALAAAAAGEAVGTIMQHAS